MQRALVLGGGGSTGVAWETGLIAGLAELGVDLSTADMFVGTSAGAIVTAQHSTGVPIAELFAGQTSAVIAEELTGSLGVGGAVQPALLAADQDLPRIDGIHAGQRLDERGLARTVLTHERVDLTRQQPEIDRVERLDAREGDGHAAHFDDR